MATRAKSRRALLLVAAVLVIFLVVTDLLSPHSVVVSAWRRMRGQSETPAEQLLKGVREDLRSQGRPRR